MDSYETSNSSAGSPADSKAFITKKEKALKGYVESYNIKVLNNKDLRIQFKEVRKPLEDLLSNKTQHKCLQTLVVTFKKESKSADGSSAGEEVFIHKTHNLTLKQKPYCLDLVPN